MLPDTAAQFIFQEAPLAHLVTFNPDGSPHITLAWVDERDGELLLATLFDQRKLANLRRDPRCAVSMEGQHVRPPGLREYLVVHGTARVEEGGAPELLQTLAGRHLGPDVAFPPMPNPPAGYVTHIAVDRVTGVGPWTD